MTTADLVTFNEEILNGKLHFLAVIPTQLTFTCSMSTIETLITVNFEHTLCHFLVSFVDFD